jgi:CDP-diacylglycerol---glycerol-3-phosphate 3-phosphatidyltransferase
VMFATAGCVRGRICVDCLDMNGPNILTTLRVFLVPIIVVILLSEIEGRNLISFGIFLLAALTDMVDGIWARRKQQVTVFGQLLDPVADKLLITSVLICLVALDKVPAWMAIVLIGRDIAVTGFRAMASARGLNIAASAFGKAKMQAQVYTIALLLLGEPILGKYYIIAKIGLWVSVTAALVSALEIGIRFGRRVLTED